MKVSAAAVNRAEATPSRRCVLETNKRGIPKGVDRGVGNSRIAEDESFEVWGVEVEVSRGTMAMAVEIRCAMTHPMIFSRRELLLDGKLGEERRNR